MKRALAALAIVALLCGIQISPAAAATDPAVVQGQTTRLYSAYFLRAPDLGGLRYWIGRLQGGQSLQSVSQFFSESSEFQSRYGSLNNGQFVDLVYQNVLGRSPDSSGRAHWVDGLTAGRYSRGGVMIGFSESNEYVAKTKTTPPRPARSFGDGTHTGVAGTWRNTGNADGCYWERLAGFGGTLEDIIANDFTYDGRSIVTVASGDAGFSSSRCGTWVPDVGPITLSPTEPFAGGTFRVGRDISPGTWRSSPGTENCYWERLSGFSGEFEELIANDLASGQLMVTISASDVGFTSTRCGFWTKVS